MFLCQGSPYQHLLIVTFFSKTKEHITLLGFGSLPITSHTESTTSYKQTLRIPNATSLFTTGDSQEEIFPVSSSLVSSFITPCRGRVKWSNSFSMKAHMIQEPLVFISHPSSSQQEALNQMTSFIFTCVMIFGLLELDKISSCPYFTDEDTEEEESVQVKDTE